MSTLSSKLRGNALTGLIASVATALIITNLTHRPAPAGGSLPLVGDELPSGAGAPIDGISSGTGSHWNVLNWAPGGLASVPGSFSYNIVGADNRTTKRMLVSSQANQDVGAAASITNMSFSNDGGKKFLTTKEDFLASAHNMTRLHDGTLLTVEFIPEWIDQAAGTVRLEVLTSKNGTTWERQDGGTVINPEGVSLQMLRVHRRILVEPDGTLIVPVYLSPSAPSTWYSAVLQSTDNGITWTFRGRMPWGAARSTNEVGWSYTSDNRLLAVLRTDDVPARLVYSFSDDHGVTWTPAEPLIGPAGKQLVGIYPDLVLQPNGTLILTTGRPDVRYLVSNDGTGRSWQTDNVVFANYPSAENNGRYDGTSGNNTLENVAANRSILFYDQCHVWGCGAYNQQSGISAEYVGVVTSGVGRIDVTSLVLNGHATISGSFAKAHKRFPEMRPLGAFDGSSAYGAEARLAGAANMPGELTVKLDRQYHLNRVGLMLGHGDAQSAKVQLSTDGKTWSAPVVTATKTIDRAMRYTDFAAQSAQYVRVTGGDPTTVLTEMELYDASLDTFDNELPYAVPRGWTDAANAWVTDVPNNIAYTDFGGFRSEGSLRLWDKWTSDNARIIRPTEQAHHLMATMQWGGADFRARFTIGTKGIAADGSLVDAWKFRFSNGTTTVVEAFDGSTWAPIGSLPSAVPARTYVPLTIDATLASATISLGSSTFTTTRRAAEVTALQSISMTTSDPQEYGGQYQIDDFAVSTDPGASPKVGALQVEPAAVTPGKPFTVSAQVTNGGQKPATGVSGALSVPADWTVQPTSSPSEIAAGGTATVSWTVTAPTSAAVGLHTVMANVGYHSGGLWLTGQSNSFQVGMGVQGTEMRSFDDEPVGVAPAKTEAVAGVTVESVSVAGTTTRAVELNDDSASTLPQITFWQGSAPRRTFAFDLLPTSTNQPTVIAVRGTGDSTFGIWRFLVSPASATSNLAIVSMYDGKAWVRLGAIDGLHNRKEFSHVDIVATPEKVTFSAHGTTLTGTARASGASSITSLEMASSGTGAVGTHTFLDNLAMTAAG